MHPTLLIQQTLQPEGAEVSPKHGRVLWGGNRLALTPQSPPSQQKQGTGTAVGVGTL